MRILYQIPSLETIYAGRTIYAGYKHSFEGLGHQFFPLTALDDQGKMFEKVQPDILITALTPFHLKYLNLKIVEQFKKKRRKGFCQHSSLEISHIQIKN